ncbi:MAG: butyrate kinase, partial [Deltaproteobacteria bacterium]|nr:butyrate kinase [Deltaproteobacteria bacterium]
TMFPIEKCIDEQLREVAGSQPTLIFPEADDPRVITAASGLIQFAKVVLVRRRDDVERDLDERGIELKVGRRRFLQSVRFTWPEDEPELCDELARELAAKSAGRSWMLDLEQARVAITKPVNFAILCVRQGYADAVLGGVTHASRDFFRPCLRLLERDGTVYEMGLFALPDSHDSTLFKQNLVMFADVALNPAPEAERLADIALGACVTMRHLIPAAELPDINGAILSYSTRGSGTGPSVDRIRNAEPLINSRLDELRVADPLYRSIHIATELQISCAISKDAARTKLGEAADLNPAVGASNVLIAPTLDTGNLLYHIYNTRYPEARSVLIIGGLRNQALDFSRGSDTEDVVVGAKALVLRMHRSGRFSRTPRDHFFRRYRILTINPGVTYTEVGLWEGRELVARQRLEHESDELADDPIEQKPLRTAVIERFLEQHDCGRDELEAVVGRGGLLLPLRSGTFAVDEAMIEHLSEGRSGAHVANLGAILAREVAGPSHPDVFIIDPVVVDELDDTARLTGLAEAQQEATWHALAQKYVAKTYAVSHGHEYEDLALIVACMGRGISVGAHRGGRCVKVRNALFDGPMSPERAGSLPGMDLIDLCFSGLDRRQVVRRISREGGLISHLGTADFQEVEQRIDSGDAQAELVFRAMAEQIAAEIAALVPKFEGEAVDRILLTGNLARSRRLVTRLEKLLASMRLGITVYPGNLELEALRDGALRVLRGIEKVEEYRPLRDRL